MKPGDVVVCVDALPERSRRVCTPLVAGRRYTVTAVRDANLGPPRGPVPDEVMLVPGDGPTDRGGWWCPSWRFRPAGAYPGLEPREAQLLEFVARRLAIEDVAPSLTEAAAALGVSIRQVRTAQRAVVAAGYVEVTGRAHRSARLTPMGAAACRALILGDLRRPCPALPASAPSAGPFLGATAETEGPQPAEIAVGVDASANAEQVGLDTSTNAEQGGPAHE